MLSLADDCKMISTQPIQYQLIELKHPEEIQTNWECEV